MELTEEKINALTDQIPQRPMGVVEGTSYSLVILFAFGVMRIRRRCQSNTTDEVMIDYEDCMFFLTYLKISSMPPRLSTCQALAFILWQFVVNFIFEPTAMQCFNHTLNRLKSDPRITVRLGATDEIRGRIKGQGR